MLKINLIIPAKERVQDLYKIIRPLIKKSYINQIILVLHKKYEGKFIKSKKLKIIVQKHPGYGSAIKEGFKISKTKFSCIFNADGSFNLNDLPKMIRLAEQNDFVFASRYLKNAGSDDDTFLTWFGNFIFTLLGKYFLKIDLTDILYTYVLCNKKSFLNLKIKNNDYRLCVELPFKVHFYKYKYTSIASHEYKRQFGEKNVNEFRDGFLILLEIIRCFKKRILH